MKLVMTILMRDEIDIVESNLAFHLENDVDHVVAIDNGSVDGTRDVLADFARSGPVTVIDEAEQNFDQSVWMTNAAIIAREKCGADWILSNDADEFWVSREGSIKDQLRKTEADALLCPRLNMLFPWDDRSDEPWATKCVFRVSNPVEVPRLADRMTDELPCPYFYLDLQKKILAKSRHLMRVDQGNHSASFDRDARVEPGAIDIFHYPVRSALQFQSKIVNGGKAYERNSNLPKEMGWHWRRLYRIIQSKGIEAALADVLPSKVDLMSDLSQGVVVEDHRMRDLLVLLEQ